MPQKKRPFMVKIAGWLISLCAFAIGFWHTHLGLRSFNILNWEYGSVVASLLILMMLLVSYYSAVNGHKIALVFYGICALFYFTFNMTSFYPNFLGRTLVKEEAISINNLLQKMVTRINDDFGDENIIKAYNKVKNLRTLLMQEVAMQSGFGERSKDYLRQINAIIGKPNIKPNIRIGSTQEERNQIAEQYGKLIDNGLNRYVSENHGGESAVVVDRINILKDDYEQDLMSIIQDNTKIDIDAVRTNPQINKMQEIVTKMDNICVDAKKISPHVKSGDIEPMCNLYGEVKSQSLGSFAHTIKSVYSRLNKVDTWGVIIFCMFIDFIVPIGVYFLIRKDEENIDDDFSSVFNQMNKNQPFNFNKK